MASQSGPWFDERSMGVVPDPEPQEAAGAASKAEPKKKKDKGDGDGKKGSGSGPTKVDKKAERAAKRAAEQAAAAAKKEAEARANDPLGHNYGDKPLIRSEKHNETAFTPISALTAELKGTEIATRARLHAVRGKGKSAFLVLRGGSATVQAVLFVGEKCSKGMVTYASKIPKESYIQVHAKVVVPETPITSTTQDVELDVFKIHSISSAPPELPFQMEDAARKETTDAPEEDGLSIRVNQDVRLDNRVLDLRTPANQAIFRLQSGVCALFREYLMANGFMEIHTPKLIGGQSEGGANVFSLDYFGRSACLAQSPQLYKQMAIASDFGRVFEIGPVFRAELSFTHRHLCEFTGLDFEMEIKEHYFEVLDVLDHLFYYIFEGIKNRYATELQAINEQHPFSPLQYLHPSQALRLTFKEGVEMLRAAGVEQNELDDLSTPTEKKLGELVKAKYGTDFYILHQYPVEARPFYTMPNPSDPQYTNSFDVFIRGEEIISGAQRIHDPALLTSRAEECGIEPDTIKDYINSFRLGCPPHGGGGVGLERVVMLYSGLPNIRKTSMFPRDPKRITP